MRTAGFRPSTNIEDYQDRPFTANDVIEQCAIAAETCLSNGAYSEYQEIGDVVAVYIRQLKDKRAYA